MEKRYQVFVSSTFEDLKEERKEVIETLLNAKYIPAGMEMFSASNDEQFKYIKKIIDNCDYYILIIGGRYGSINSQTGISYTEQEYEYALSKNIPVLAFIHSKPEDLPPEKREDDKKIQLDNFRNKVSTNRLCKMWSNRSELISSVIISLTEEISENPQLGWVRGSNYDTTDLLSQINELRQEKEMLIKEIQKLTEELEIENSNTEDIASGNDIYTVKGKRYHNSHKTYYSHSFDVNWDDIFSCVGPFLISPKNYIAFKNNLESGLNSAFSAGFSSLNEDSVQTIKIQLSALGLIEAKPGNAVGGGISEFIKLTDKGRRYLMQIKSIKRE